MSVGSISKLNLDGTERPIRDGTNFVGTLAEWEALTDAQKEQYNTYDITDDYTNANAVTEDDFVVIEKTLYFPYHPRSDS